MAEQLRAAETHALATITRLVIAADGDTLYRDVYLRRALELLAPIVSEASWAAALTGHEQLARLLSQAQAAVARRDWPQVREVGARAAALQRSIGSEQRLMDAAGAVYAASAVVVDPLSPGLTSKRWADPARAVAEVTAALADLAVGDAPLRDHYVAREQALAALAVPRAAETSSESASTASVEQEALQALERGDASGLEALANAMLGRRAEPADGTPAPRAGLAVPSSLGEPLPEASESRARALGLERVETPLVPPAIADAITEFTERYAVGASPAVYDRAADGVARVAAASQEIDVPPDVKAVFAETISLFALHLFVNSAGLRYVPPPIPREILLVETHAEGDEAVTPLVRELGLQHRGGLARDDLEQRLLHHGARLLRDHLGLDPLAFRLVCIPPDVYMRIGVERGWGRSDKWTHFDGYQVMKGGRLRALVGGNARFGGLADLCSISPADARENTVARFAVVRRDRLGVRLT